MRRLRAHGSLLAFLTCAALAGCGGDSDPSGPNGPNGPDEEQNPPDDGHVHYDPANPCKYTLDEIIADLNNDYEVPAWEMLDCYRDGLTRTRPSFYKRLLVSGDVTEFAGHTPGRAEHLDHLAWWDELWTEHPVNVSSHLYGTFGPFVDGRPDDPADWTPIEFPLYPDYHDDRLRYGMVAVLREKHAGRPVLMTQFVPPGDDQDGIPLFATAQEFKDWHEDVWIPWRVEEAKVAERFLVDYYAPTGELESLFQRQETLLQTLSPEEQVELVQWLVDETLAAIDPHYDGVIVAYSYARFAAWGWHWQEMSYAGYDEIAFPLLPECSVDNVEPYMNEQFQGYATIVENSGNIPWRVSELDMARAAFEVCAQDFEAIEADLYEEAFRVLDDPPMPSDPVGVSFASTLIETEEAWEAIHDYFQSH